MTTLKCQRCKTVKPNVSYSIDYNGLICNPCDRELYEEYAKAQLRHNPLGHLTWGGWVS